MLAEAIDLLKARMRDAGPGLLDDVAYALRALRGVDALTETADRDGRVDQLHSLEQRALVLQSTFSPAAFRDLLDELRVFLDHEQSLARQGDQRSSSSTKKEDSMPNPTRAELARRAAADGYRKYPEANRTPQAPRLTETERAELVGLRIHQRRNALNARAKNLIEAHALREYVRPEELLKFEESQWPGLLERWGSGVVSGRASETAGDVFTERYEDTWRVIGASAADVFEKVYNDDW